MFDSVLDRGVAPSRRLATGVVVSVLGHAAVLTLALLVRPPAVVEEAEKAIPTIIIPAFRPAAAPGPKGGGGGAPAHAAPARASHPRRELLAPAFIPKRVDLEIEAPPDEAITEGGKIGPVDPSPGIDPPGDGKGGGGGDGEGSCSGGGCDVLGMTAPILLERGREPDYTQDALEAHVQGLMTVQCVLTAEGRFQQCRVIRPLPYMERAVVEALMTRRYSPATLHGRPLAVRYTVQVKLVMPQ